MVASSMDNSTTFPSDTLLNMSSNIEKPDEILFTHAEAVVLAVVVAFLTAFGIVANITTFVVIAKSKRLSASPFNIMIMSLCISDLLSALDSPFVLYRRTFGYFVYPLPEVVCKATMAVDFWTTNATIHHILAFIILRIIAIQFPSKGKHFTVNRARILACIIWLETLAANFIFYMWFPTVYPASMKSPTGKACTANRIKIPHVRLYAYTAFPITLFLPMALIILSAIYLVVVIMKRRTARKNEAKDADEVVSISKENFAMVQMSLIVLSFLFGYIPDIAYRITTISYFARGAKYHGRGPWRFLLASHMCVRISECLNPIFYNLASRNLRTATKDSFRRRCLRNYVEQHSTNHNINMTTMDGRTDTVYWPDASDVEKDFTCED